MSFENDIPFGVTSLHTPTAASFSSVFEDSHIAVVANNSNENTFLYNNQANVAIYGTGYADNYQHAYIGVQTSNLMTKLATFNEDTIDLLVNTKISGHLLPKNRAEYDIGAEIDTWKNIYAQNVNVQSIDTHSFTLNGETITNFNQIGGTGDGSGGGGLNTNSLGDVKIAGTLEVDDIIVNNHISILNKSVYSSECLDIVNYTDKSTFNIKQIGTGDVFKISNDYTNIFTMKNNGFFGNVNDPIHNIHIQGSIRADEFYGDGTNLVNVNLSDKTTTELEEGLNLYFTQDRVSHVLWSSNYITSNPFTPYLDTITDSLDEFRYAVYGINLDKIYQGNSNKYIVNNIYNDSMVINGTLRVKNIELLDEFDTNIDSIYNNSLFEYSNSISNYDFGAGRVTFESVSNILYNALSNVDFQNIYNMDSVTDYVSNMFLDINDHMIGDINSLNTNVVTINNSIQGLETAVYDSTLDRIVQGTSNKFIENNLYDNSLYVNGTLTVKNIEFVDIENFYEVFQTSLPESSEYFMNTEKVESIVENVLTRKNFEGQIDDSYELISYALESEKTDLVIRINLQANQITALNDEVDTLKSDLQNALTRIEALESML